jgi:hypothetical protein
MKNYSIIRIGNEYVVQAGEKSVMKVASRRKATRLVTDAAELLDSHVASPIAPVTGTESPLTLEPGIMPDLRENT